MSEDVLMVSDAYRSDGDSYLAWFCDGEEGGIIGDDPKSGTGPEPTDRDDWETWIAAKLARESGAERDSRGFHWPSAKAAAAVLRLIKAAWKNRTTPLPDWAQKALAAGWKPPKGWKP